MSKLKSHERLCLEEQTHIASRPNKVINRAKKKVLLPLVTKMTAYGSNFYIYIIKTLIKTCEEARTVVIKGDKLSTSLIYMHQV